MPSRKSQTFVDRHELWSAEQHRAAAAVEREVKRRKLEVVRFAFADQHGVLRGKTLVASDAARAMRAGVAMTSTLLAIPASDRIVNGPSPAVFLRPLMTGTSVLSTSTIGWRG